MSVCKGKADVDEYRGLVLEAGAARGRSGDRVLLCLGFVQERQAAPVAPAHLALVKLQSSGRRWKEFESFPSQGCFPVPTHGNPSQSPLLMPGLHSFICPSILPFIHLACPPKRLLCIHSSSFMLLSPLGKSSQAKVGPRLPLHLIAHNFKQVYTPARFTPETHVDPLSQGPIVSK